MASMHAGAAPVRLRPHHLLCTQCYRGMGYSDSFVRNMDKVVAQLYCPETAGEERGTSPVEVVFGADDICRACPRLRADGSCIDDSRVLAIDARAVEAFGIQEGVADYHELRDAIRATASIELLEAVCAGCEWAQTAGCARIICERN